MTSTFTSIGEAAQRVVLDCATPAGIESWPVTDRASWMARRQQDITASMAGALFGVHDHTTRYEAWAQKSGLIDTDDAESRAMRRGKKFEPIAIDEIEERHPTWKLHRPNRYYRDHVARIGATPDLFAIDPLRPGFGVVQIKSVDPFAFRRKWQDEDRTIAPPLWIAVQALIEAKLTGASWAMVAAVYSFELDLALVDIPLHDALYDRIKTETAAFWLSVESGKPPVPDYERDGDVIALLNPITIDVPPIDLSTDNLLPALVSEREELMARMRSDEKRKATIDAEITDKLAGHSVGLLSDGRRILRTMQTRRYKARDAYETSFPVIKIKGAA